MFGGLCFLVHGKMALGIVRDDLMVRVGADGYDEALELPHAREMDFTGKPLKGMVYVAPAGLGQHAGLARWVRMGVACAAREATRSRSKPAKARPASSEPASKAGPASKARPSKAERSSKATPKTHAKATPKPRAKATPKTHAKATPKTHAKATPKTHAKATPKTHAKATPKTHAK
ncbi:MAG: TfoX/Sxy family protein, partial [Sandaracinaceae bacterium]|nr:TfoX/Sxy family protein [Sandaracinaceae bacterium]